MLVTTRDPSMGTGTQRQSFQCVISRLIMAGKLYWFRTHEHSLNWDWVPTMTHEEKEVYLRLCGWERSKIYPHLWYSQFSHSPFTLNQAYNFETDTENFVYESPAR